MPFVGNENKKMASRNECKFLDDDFRSFSAALHQHKGYRHISYNPFIGGYNTTYNWTSFEIFLNLNYNKYVCEKGETGQINWIKFLW